VKCLLATATPATIVVSLLIMLGCDQPPQAASQAEPKQVAGDPPAQSDQSRTTWDVYYMKGSRVGYGRTTTSSAVESGRPVVRIDGLNRLSIKRLGQRTDQMILCSSLETPAGELIRFDCRMTMGPTPIRTTGQVGGNRLDIETVSEGKKLPSSIPWSPEWGGPFATEQTLRRNPMRPGEHRTLKALMIGFNQAADVEMAAKDYEPTGLLGGTYDLLRIESVTRFADGQKLEGTVWTDRTGKTLKTHSQAMGLETYRTTEALALEKAGTAGFDLFADMSVKLDRPLPNAHHTKQVRYRVRLDGGDPAGVFVTGPTQQIKSIDAHTAEVTVYAIRPGEPGGNRRAPADPPTDADRRPNNMIQSDDPAIVAEAKEAAGQQKDPWRVAMALERYVHRAITKKDFSQAFATAAEVAKSHEGDCTEHAVFLAALARARGIPARVAIGLLYMDGSQSFGYHMWTEVYIDQRWIPIDGTLALGGIGAAHLKLAQSNLAGASAYSAFLPVAQVAGRLKIEVVEAFSDGAGPATLDKK